MALVTELTARRLHAVLADVQRSGRLPSVVAALTRDGALVWRGSVGEATGTDAGPPLDLQYRIGSITKTMTAVMVLQCRDLGLLGLDDPLSTYVPEAQLDVTVRDLLTHLGGLPAEPAGDWWERVEGDDFVGLVTRLREAGPPLPRRFTHHYSNVGYGLLGEVVARARGHSWWECLSLGVLQPLGMLRTTYDPFEPHARGFSVAPYDPRMLAEPATDTRAMAPAGQLWSTVMDLATYADFLLTGHRDVLSRETLEEMGIPQSGTAMEGLRSGYGLGLRLVPGGTGTLVGHTGSMPGFQAALFVDRGRRAAGVVMANATSGLPTDRVVADLLETLEEWEPTAPDPWVPVETVPTEVEELLGTWFWGATERVCRWDGGTLTFTSVGGRTDCFRLTADGFVGTAGYHHGESLEVVRGPDGAVSHLRCSTFVFTRHPYDPAAPIPGGPPR